MNKIDSCSLLPDFLLSARRQRAAGSLWSDMGRWLCGPVPRSGPWGALETGEQLHGEGKTLAVSRVVAGKEEGIEKENIGMSGDFQAETETHHHSQTTMGVPVESYHAAIYTKVYIHFLFSESILKLRNSTAIEEEQRRRRSPW